MFTKNELAGLVKAQVGFKTEKIKDQLSDEFDEYVIRFSDGSIVYCDGLKDQNSTVKQLLKAGLVEIHIEPKNKNEGTQRSPMGL